MKYLLFGAGLQGTAIAHDLLKAASGTTSLVVLDGQAGALQKLAGQLADDRLRTVVGDVRDSAAIVPLLEQRTELADVSYNTGATNLSSITPAENCRQACSSERAKKCVAPD